MNRKTLSVVLALLIVLSAGVTAVAVVHKDLLKATGQNIIDPYALTPTVTPSETPSVTPSVTPSETPSVTPPAPVPVTPDPISNGQKMEAGGITTYEYENFRVVNDNGVIHFEWDLKNNLDVPMTITPYIQLSGCDVRRTGTEPGYLPYVFAGASEGCPARGTSLDLSFTSAEPSAADGTHESTLVRLSFQASTLNIPGSSTQSNATSNVTIVGNSVKNKFVALHPEANKTKPINATELRKGVCDVNTTIGRVNGTTIVLQPGESMTVASTVTSADWGFGCTPVNSGLINYNVQAGGSSYAGLKTSQLIVFGQEDSNICGT